MISGEDRAESENRVDNFSETWNSPLLLRQYLV